MISLYSGIGGLDSGFASVGFTPSFANDLDPHAENAYKEVLLASVPGLDMSSHEYLVGDISSDFAGLQKNEEAILVGGPPCQGFSRAGRMNPDDERSKHVRHYMQAVTAIAPRAFVMENVAALATNERWRPVLHAVRRSARRSGYATALLVLDAADYGVPQARKRMFLIGLKGGSAESVRRLRDGSPKLTLTVRQALADIASYDDQPNRLKSHARITPALRPVLRKSPFAGMPFNGQGRFLNLDSIAPTISASLGGNHTPIVDQNWLENPEEEGAAIKRYIEGIRRGHTERVSAEWRRLTVLEAARMQGFPPTLLWDAPKSVAFRQIGNAVPPPLAAEVALRVGRALGISLKPALDSDQRDIAA